jgi:hypothetical protein
VQTAAFVVAEGKPTEAPAALSCGLLFHDKGAGAAWRTPPGVAQGTQIQLQFIDSAAESIAVHPEYAGSFALIAVIFLKYGDDEPLLEFPYGFGIQDVASVHLHDQSFELILHDGSPFGNSARSLGSGL